MQIVSYFLTLREPSVNRRRALTLVGTPRDNPEVDPLALLHLGNQLCMQLELVYNA